MQLSKEMSFLTSFSTISFAPFIIQLNNTATVLCSNKASLYNYICTEVFVFSQKQKEGKKIMSIQTTEHTIGLPVF